MTKDAAIAEAKKVASEHGLDMVVFDDRVNDEYLPDDAPYNYAPTDAWRKLWERFCPAAARVSPDGTVTEPN